MFTTQYASTKRLRIAYYRAGSNNKHRLMFLHGNLSSSVYVLPLFERLSKTYDIVAPDLRGFGKTERVPIDASRGYRDWSDDIFELVTALGWNNGGFTLCGWSMGGDVAMQFAIDHAALLSNLVLLCPGPPYGFGGSVDAEGSPLEPLGLGSGAGASHPALTFAIDNSSRFLLRDILTRYYFTPPFRMSRLWENRLLDAIGEIAIGDDFYPGTFKSCDTWPYVLPGDRGVLNTMSPTYGNLSAFISIKRKPPVLWIRGENDRIVSNNSLMEFGYLGKIGLLPGWPGEDVYPPQPMIDQLQSFFEKYRNAGGSVVESIIPGGHMCALESPDEFVSQLNTFLL